MNNTNWVVDIAFDTATHNTGIAMFINKTLISYGVIECLNENFSGNKFLKDTASIETQLIRFLSPLKYKTQEVKEINIILEMSNHGNIRVGQKLSVYNGLFGALIVHYVLLLKPQATINFKFVNPKEWQLRAFSKVLDRNAGKSESIERAKHFLQIGETSKITDDMADAINIASLSQVLRDNYFVGQEVKKRENIYQKSKIAIARLTTKATELYNKLREKQEKRLFRIVNTKKFKNKQDKELLEPKSLYDLATSAEKLRIEKYKNEMEQLQADIKVIKDFYILGKNE